MWFWLLKARFRKIVLILNKMLKTGLLCSSVINSLKICLFCSLVINTLKLWVNLLCFSCQVMPEKMVFCPWLFLSVFKNVFVFLYSLILLRDCTCVSINDSRVAQNVCTTCRPISINTKNLTNSTKSIVDILHAFWYFQDGRKNS